MSKDKAGSMLDEMIALAGWRDAHQHILGSLSRSLKVQFREVVKAIQAVLLSPAEPEAMFALYSNLSARAKLFAQTADYLAANTAVLINRAKLDAMLSAGEGEAAPEPKAQPVSDYGKADPARFVPLGDDVPPADVVQEDAEEAAREEGAMPPLAEVPDDPAPDAPADQGAFPGTLHNPFGMTAQSNGCVNVYP